MYCYIRRVLDSLDALRMVFSLRVVVRIDVRPIKSSVTNLPHKRWPFQMKFL